MVPTGQLSVLITLDDALLDRRLFFHKTLALVYGRIKNPYLLLYKVLFKTLIL